MRLLNRIPRTSKKFDSKESHSTSFLTANQQNSPIGRTVLTDGKREPGRRRRRRRRRKQGLQELRNEIVIPSQSEFGEGDAPFGQSTIVRYHSDGILKIARWILHKSVNQIGGGVLSGREEKSNDQDRSIRSTQTLTY
jgi:hypothetical protein